MMSAPAKLLLVGLDVAGVSFLKTIQGDSRFTGVHVTLFDESAVTQAHVENNVGSSTTLSRVNTITSLVLVAMLDKRDRPHHHSVSFLSFKIHDWPPNTDLDPSEEAPFVVASRACLQSVSLTHFSLNNPCICVLRAADSVVQKRRGRASVAPDPRARAQARL
jgi:hypothetical protein